MAEIARPIVKATAARIAAVKKQNNHFSAVTLLGMRNLRFKTMLGPDVHYPDPPAREEQRKSNQACVQSSKAGLAQPIPLNNQVQF